MPKVNRDSFDLTSDAWLEARSALLQLFTPHNENEEGEASGSLQPTPLETPDAEQQGVQQVSNAAAQIAQDHLSQNALEQLALQQLPNDFKLSVVVPVFNEATTIEQVLRRLIDFPLPLEIIVVDDGSQDGTRALLQSKFDDWRAELPSNKSMQLILHDGNQGKGAALKTGFGAVTGTVVAIQDADLEYDPLDFIWLLGPILNNQADVVYGSRFSKASLADSPFWHRWGNQAITLASNLTTGMRWSDVETCYKIVRASVLQKIGPSLKEKGFGIELELTAKLARYPGLRFYERPIRYEKRGYADGKKIGVKDGLWAGWCILRYRIAD